jgi:16S rRNA (uracil1498-N3)-methyltransferase
MNRIVVEPEEIHNGRVELRDNRADHIRNVLGATVGQALKVGVADGKLGLGEVVRSDASGVELALTLEGDGPEPWCDLILAMPRPRVLKRLWAQVAALGVGRLFLIHAARVETCYFGSHWLRPAAYRPLLIEGLMQAGTTRVPHVFIEPKLKRFADLRLPVIAAGAVCFIAHPDAAPTNETGWPTVSDGRRPVIAVGPEGGWMDDEVALFESHGFRRISLGRRILRTDTACVALLATLGRLFDGQTPKGCVTPMSQTAPQFRKPAGV